MSWKEIRYYPLTLLFLLMLLFVGCSIVIVIGKDNIVKTEQTDDPNTTTNIDSLQILTTSKKREQRAKEIEEQEQQKNK